MISPIDVAIIILNYNNAKDTILCVKSLMHLNNKPGAIIIIDNHSEDNSVYEISKFLKQIEHVKIIENLLIQFDFNNEDIFFILLNSNDGYSKGNNFGIKFAQKLKHFKAFWILNNDTIVDENALDALCKKLNQENKPSIIGSTIVHMDDMTTLQCASGYNSRLMIAFDKPLLSGKKINDLSNINLKPIEKKISYIIGASFFIHSNVLEIGYFREDFFLYAEEIEYCIRAKKQGIPLLWAKDSIVYHKEGGSTKASSSSYDFPDWVEYLMIRNRTRIIAEYYKNILPLCWICSFMILIRRLLLKKTVRPLLMYKAMWNGTFGKMGKPKNLFPFRI